LPTCSKPFSPSHNFGAFQQLIGAEPIALLWPKRKRLNSIRDK